MGPLLTELGRRTGQAGALDRIDLLVRSPSALRKRPWLVLVGLRPGVAPLAARAEDVEGAVLLYEYGVAGAWTGVLATDDIYCERTVLASPGMRAEVAAQACRMLMDAGAVAALISYAGSPCDPPGSDAGRRPCSFAVRTRSKERDLPLGALSRRRWPRWVRARGATCGAIACAW